ncbi:MAG: GGDEF domain-containing protein [Lachnospiraceae bacterium]|nr:GGDEF domain-containing protein [Lachnospiraceae bacterium]
MKLGIKTKYLVIYLTLVFAFTIFFICLFFYDKTTDVKQMDSPYAVTIWKDYNQTITYTKTNLTGTIDTNAIAGNLLAFHSIHQTILVYENEQLIYQYPTQNINPFSLSPGYSWNFVQLPKNGINNIRIEISSPYKEYLKAIPNFLLGNHYSIASYICGASLMPFVLCIVMFFLGAGMVVYYLALSKSVVTTSKLFHLGIFAIALSIWSINECPVTLLLLKNNIVSSYIAFLSLMMLPLPFASFVKTFYEDNNPIWDTFFKMNLCQIVCCLILQFAGVADLRETLWTTHVMMGILVAIIFYNSFMLFRNGIQTDLVKIHLACIVICGITLLLDIMGYYLGTWDGNTFGRFGFLSYIIVLGISSTKESASLMQMGQKASDYQQLAYTDQMTGMNNRTCFNVDFAKFSETPEDVTIVDFDLNNLKYINDTFGHSSGDRYIKSCSNIIREIFDGIGKCYRVGGDEFVAIIENSSHIDMKQYMAMLESSVDACNRANKEFRMQIAYGCAVYAAEVDKTLEDTYNRADKIMYKDKEEKKAKKGSHR